MTANFITIFRIVLAFFVIILFQAGLYFRLAAIILTILVIYLDSLDGYVARKLGLASDFGALFDITGDRIVEHVYLIFFAAMGVLSFWVPIIFVARSFLVDTLRSAAYSRKGKTPFGDKTMMKSKFTKFLTASRFSRAVYGVSKVVVFILLGAILMFQKGFQTNSGWISYSLFRDIRYFTFVLVWIMVAFNLIRGIPVLWDGRFFLMDKYLPRELKGDS